MNFRKQHSIEPTPMQLAPLVDVLFLLVIFFAVTFQYAKDEQVMDVSVPAADSGKENESRTVGEIIINIKKPKQKRVEFIFAKIDYKINPFHDESCGSDFYSSYFINKNFSTKTIQITFARSFEHYPTMPKDNSIQSVLIIGSGPIIIGQACEFDYSGTQAARSLREEGVKVILINSNPATIMTDPMMADRVYLLPLTVESIEQILEENQIDAVLPTMGGQTALNLCKEVDELGIWEKNILRIN
jgi:hypothetical protein